MDADEKNILVSSEIVPCEYGTLENECSIQCVSSTEGADMVIAQRTLSRGESIFLNYEDLSRERSELSLSLSTLLDQTRLPRPCYYMLRIIGVWQPREANCIWHTYNILCYGIFLMSLVSILILGYVNRRHGEMVWRTGEILNSCCTILNLGCPFLFIKHYSRYGNYDKLVACVLQTSSSNKAKVIFLSRLYSALSVVIWMMGSTFFLVHWIPFFYEYWHYIIYVTTVVYTNGWWAAWLSIYGFVCNVHRLQAKNFISFMQERYKLCKGDKEEEKRAVGNLLASYNELQRWIERTQSDFNKVISFAIAYHILDMVVFSYAYWHKDFGDNYPIWQYIGGMMFDFSSIAIKLCPVALVSAAVHELTMRCGKECYQNIASLEYPKDRFLFFNHVVHREVDYGLRILGVKITVKMAIGILVTIATATATFLRFIIPKLTPRVL